jgi:hypothetical protein
VELVEQALLVGHPRLDLPSHAADFLVGLREAEARVGGGAPQLAGGQYADCRTLGAADAQRMHGHAEQGDGVDEDEGWFERPSGAVDVQLYGLVARRVERHELGGHVADEGVVEGTAQEHDPALEELGPEEILW